MNASKVDVGLAARRDLRKFTLWLRSHADVETATRFAVAAISGFATLARSPGVGPVVPSNHRHLSGLRKWRVPGFASYLIFYRITASGIEIVRVLHAAQDWWALLDAD